MSRTKWYNNNMNDYEKYKDLGVGFPSLSPEQVEEIKRTSPPEHNDFTVLSPCFYKKEPEMVKNSKKLLQQEDVNYITYGDGEPFTNKVYTNLLRLYSKLEEIEDQFDTVLIMDAKDVLYLGGSTVLMTLSRYRAKTKTSPAVILTTEKECYPKGSDIFYIPQVSPNRFLNSGLMIGPTNLIKVMIREMILKYDLERFEMDNGSLNHSQIYWHRYFNEGKLKDNLRVDLDNEFFFCMDSCDPYHVLEIINPLKIRVKETDTFPKFFHFNRCFIDTYKQWFGEFWVEKLGRS